MPPPSLHALRQYAITPSPSSSFPASVLLFSNPSCIVIFDAYPKAKYHFLVLPRYPYHLSSSQASSSKVQLDHLDNIKSLLKAPRDVRKAVLDSMGETAREVEEMIKDEMIKTEGFEWGVNMGFHSIPSMKHLHLHVISDDFISPSLKTKRHVNSFRPDLKFLLPLQEVQMWIEDEQTLSKRIQSLNTADEILKIPLACHLCGESFPNMPAIKSHYDQEFAKRRRKRGS
ncbi:HIT-like domain-containing protein [Kockovaella imperatae]|uniref:HIT-like domain-containing protein n=1 Tax=Kockovaella imperatae TaxID=4999 RepID=A0A1Y1UQ20_9TREE|nr:HIT-like domain-containing protein [Kockovaella imperatae]ORX40131.1 HIT-like domain-containing protein [Kockovaella imperatae]